VAALVGWLIDVLGLPVALAVMVLTVLAGAAGVNSLFKRIRNNGKRA
jgi:F0F1-type ATP synthase assembly protein I